MRIGKVAELFDIRGRGVVVITDVSYALVDPRVRLE